MQFIQAVKDGHLVNAKEYFERRYLNNPDEHGLTPVHWACINNHIQVLQWLIKKKSQVDSKDPDGWRPIHYASWKCHKEIITILINNYCDITTKTNDGHTSLDIAMQNINNDYVNMLTDVDENRQVGLRMGLTCSVTCRHNFCLSSLSSGNFKKGALAVGGKTGNVYRIKESLGDRIFAVKKMDLTSDDANENTKYLERNLNTYVTRLKHKRITKYYGVIRKSYTMFIFMEYMENGSLADQLDNHGPFSHDKIARYCQHILQGLEFLHSNGIVHRNIKGSNILLGSNDQCKLADFKLSRILDGSNEHCKDNDEVKVTTFCGTANFMAPEVMNSIPYSYPCDLWSLGATVVEMLTGHAPYHNKDELFVLRIISTTRKLDIEGFEDLDDDFKGFVNRILQPEPNNRGTATELLEYPFVKCSPPDQIGTEDRDDAEVPLDIVCDKKREDCIDILQAAIANRQVGINMGLKCGADCKHELCLSSISSTNFQRVNLIRSGGFGKIYKLHASLTGDVFAMKSIKINRPGENKINYVDSEDVRNIEKNINNYQHILQHENIITYYGATRRGSKLFIFMEYLEGGSLKDKLKTYPKIPRHNIARYSKDILSGLQFLHEHYIIHRDVKCSNILMDKKDRCKLADFGTSCSLAGQVEMVHEKDPPSSNSFCGTPNYMAPEVVKKIPYSYSCDIWSFGVTAIEMLTGHPPFHDLDPMAVIFKITNMEKMSFQTTEPLSKDLEKFMTDILEIEPSRRATASELLSYEFLLQATIGY